MDTEVTEEQKGRINAEAQRALRKAGARLGFGGIWMETLRVKTGRRTQFVDVTAAVERVVREAGVGSGVCYVYVPHTTAGVTINEHADPDVATDLEGVFDRLVPHAGPYRHSEGNTDSHAKAVMVGASQVIFVEDGKLVLGGWKVVFLFEFGGPREGKVFVRVEKSAG